jgi:hypothetical protein
MGCVLSTTAPVDHGYAASKPAAEASKGAVSSQVRTQPAARVTEEAAKDTTKSDLTISSRLPCGLQVVKAGHEEEPEQSSQVMCVLNDLTLPDDEDVRWDALDSYKILDTVRGGPRWRQQRGRLSARAARYATPGGSGD